MAISSNKARTSISIDPTLLKVAKDYAASFNGRNADPIASGDVEKMSLSAIVTLALKAYLPSKKETPLVSAENGYHTNV
jgi:hypothetical protein